MSENSSLERFKIRDSPKYPSEFEVQAELLVKLRLAFPGMTVRGEVWSSSSGWNKARLDLVVFSGGDAVLAIEVKRWKRSTISDRQREIYESLECPYLVCFGYTEVDQTVTDAKRILSEQAKAAHL